MLRLADGRIELGAKAVAQPLEHEVEGCELLILRRGTVPAELLRNVLEDAKHRAGARRVVFAGKGVLARELTHRRHEHVELVGHEGIGSQEVIEVAILAVALGTIRKVEEHSKIRLALFVDA